MANVINGTSGDDYLYGTDPLFSYTGADLIHGYGGDDRIFGEVKTVKTSSSPVTL